MDTSKRDILGECLPYLQQHVSATDRFYACLVQRKVFPEDVLNIIRSRPTVEQQITEMVEQLKRRPDKAFENFLLALENSNQEFIAEHLKKRYNAGSDGSRTLGCNYELLQQQNADLNRKIDFLEKKLRNRQDEYNYVKEDNKRLKKNVEELTRERNVLYSQAIHLKKALDACQIEPISSPVSSAPSDDLLLAENEAEEQLADKDQQLQELNVQKLELQQQLDHIVIELERVRTARRRLTEELDLDDTASDQDIIDYISQIKVTQVKKVEEIEKLVDRLNCIQQEKWELEEDNRTLTERCENLNNRLQLIEAEKKRYIYPATRVRPTVVRSRNDRSGKEPDHVQAHPINITLQLPRENGPTLVAAGLLPQTERSYIDSSRQQLMTRSKTMHDPTHHRLSQVPILPPIVTLPPTQRDSHPTSTRNAARYCILCRQDFYLSADDDNCCKIHFRKFRVSRYECCSSEEKKSPGCITVGHLYLRLTNEYASRSGAPKLEITDGLGLNLAFSMTRGYRLARSDK